VRFEWDRRKAARNVKRHAVSFTEAASAFGDPLSVTIHDPFHSRGEDRFVLIGRTSAGRLVVVVHVDRGDRIRIISARIASPAERRSHEEGEA